MFNRTLVAIKCHGENYSLAKFVDCLVHQFERSCDKDCVATLVKCTLEDNLLKLCPFPKPTSITRTPLIHWNEDFGKFVDANQHIAMLHHSPECPVGNLSEDDISSIPSEIAGRGIDVAVSVLVESKDSLILMTKRPEHMRTFPRAWVPPGGHIEQKESLIEAGLRELKEETGLSVSSDATIEVLCLWESVYPVMLGFGTPVRHHVVLDPEEVQACAWLSPEAVRFLFNSSDCPMPQQSMLALQPGGELHELPLDLTTMYNSALWSRCFKHDFSGAQMF
ncbi:hypothetical protein B566_EDAN008458 [Ephemera danica]|nr:hypothetical protein B566_EDAN008458 [Ephemera danica]